MFSNFRPAVVSVEVAETSNTIETKYSWRHLDYRMFLSIHCKSYCWLEKYFEHKSSIIDLVPGYDVVDLKFMFCLRIFLPTFNFLFI